MQLFTSKFINKPDYVTELDGSVTAPSGFKASGVKAGLKPSGKADIGLLISEAPCSSAVLLTKNAAAAAPVKICKSELDRKELQAIVVNSGSANACTGAKGKEDALAMVALAASATGVEQEKMAVASTGVIGVPLPMDKIQSGVKKAAAALSEDGGDAFAQAIKTTDDIDKSGAIEVELSGGNVKIGACAKGAGMIAPNMATMLAFITTDADISSGPLGKALKEATFDSFNAVSVDGDMSTNDCVFLIANGKSGVSVEAADLIKFTKALAVVCKSLALKMVADGEGASKVVELKVAGADSNKEAALVARAISTSSLVRTAFYGRDANWGRIMASAGAALAGEKELSADIYYDDVCLAVAGGIKPEPADDTLLGRIMEKPEISVTIDLHRGKAERTMYFSDLTAEYVKFNAEYTT